MAARRTAAARSTPTKPQKPWGTKTGELPKYVLDSLYQVYHFLGKDTRQRVGLMMKIPVFIQDPLVAQKNPTLGVQEIDVRLEAGMADGPTSSRIAVVDFNADTQKLTPPVVWNREVGWFHSPPAGAQGDGGSPAAGEWLPDAPPETSRSEAVYKEFIDKSIKNVHYHQLNVWAVVQRVLEFYEDPQALGRPVPWGFDGNRLIVVPHAGYGENAFYDQHSKSLQFYYFGDLDNPGYTCLSHDIITHETGHAILDGIRPLYNQSSSVQTAAFHEFIGDLTAILIALFNKDIRHFVADQTQGDLQAADTLANLAEQFGEQVEGRPYLRTAFNQLTLQDVQGSLSPHKVSQVLTGAMFDILIGIARKISEKPDQAMSGEVGGQPVGGMVRPERALTPREAIWRAADYFRRMALQPLDLCPPADIQFLDYAKAVLRNDIMTNPVDERGYREVMFTVFHHRGLCPCAYQPGADLPDDCLFNEILEAPKVDFVYHNIDRLSGSRTAAYYFLSDNRTVLRIPAHQDVVVADLYDNRKFGAAAERLPREVVLEYTWQEEVPLVGERFGRWNGKTFNLICGGTLVFDERGNLLSWSRKPGTQHISAGEVQVLRARLAAWNANPVPENKKNRLTKQELAELADLEQGEQRIQNLLDYFAAVTRRGLVGEPQPANPFMDGLKPVVAIEDSGVVRFEITPHLRKNDFDTEGEGWTVSY